MYIDNQCSSSADSFETKYCIVDQSTIPHYHHLHRKLKNHFLNQVKPACSRRENCFWFGLFWRNCSEPPNPSRIQIPSKSHVLRQGAVWRIHHLLRGRQVDPVPVTSYSAGRRAGGVCWGIREGSAKKLGHSRCMFVIMHKKTSTNMHKPILLPTPYQTGGLL